MRWKCSLLTEEELEDMEDWISDSVVEKEEKITAPWKAGKGGDKLSTKNEFFQRYAPPRYS